jgi:hypothetical protein
MYSSLPEMLASAYRDELQRQASQHRVAHQAHRSRRDAAGRNAPGVSPARRPYLRFALKRSQVFPAIAA